MDRIAPRNGQDTFAICHRYMLPLTGHPESRLLKCTDRVQVIDPWNSRQRLRAPYATLNRLHSVQARSPQSSSPQWLPGCFRGPLPQSHLLTSTRASQAPKPIRPPLSPWSRPSNPYLIMAPEQVESPRRTRRSATIATSESAGRSLASLANSSGASSRTSPWREA